MFISRSIPNAEKHLLVRSKSTPPSAAQSAQPTRQLAPSHRDHADQDHLASALHCSHTQGHVAWTLLPTMDSRHYSNSSRLATPGPTLNSVSLYRLCLFVTLWSISLVSGSVNFHFNTLQLFRHRKIRITFSSNYYIYIYVLT